MCLVCVGVSLKSRGVRGRVCVRVFCGRWASVKGGAGGLASVTRERRNEREVTGS